MGESMAAGAVPLRETLRKYPALLVVIGVAEVIAVVATATINEHDHIDGEVYQLGARAWWAGQDFYAHLPATESGLQLPFIYPPFAAMLFSPLALMPKTLAIAVIMLATHLALMVTLHLVLRTSTFLAPQRETVLLVTAGVLPLATILEPVQETIGYGQINVVIMAMVALDCLWRVRGPRRLPYPRGLLLGIAVGIKLTPAAFVLFFLLRRDYRAILASVAGFLGTVVLGFVGAFSQARYYWLGGGVFSNSEVSFGPQFVGDPATWGGNLSLRSLVGKTGLGEPWLNVALVPLLAAAAALAVAGMVHALRQRDLPLALVINAALALLASPISWSNHWVWAAPTLVLLGGAAYTRQNWALLMATAMSAGLFVMRPHWLLPQGDGKELEWDLFQYLVANTYVLLGLAFLLYTAVQWLRSHRQPQQPGSLGQPSTAGHTIRGQNGNH